MYSNRLTDLLKIIIKICYILLAACVVGMYFLAFGNLKIDGEGILLIDDLSTKLIAIPFFFVVPAGYVALVCIDKLLSIVKQNRVFEPDTLKFLNIITIACLYASLVGIVSLVVCLIIKPYTYVIVFTALSMGEIFMALVLQVIRLVFKRANELKEENDLTI